MILPYPRPVEFPPDACVLVVDDEAGVRKLIRLFLEQHEISVLDVSSGADALEVLERERGRVRMVITDLLMPGMPGHELAARIWRRQPTLPIFFISGNSDQLLEEPHPDFWMQKPLDFPRLVDIVTERVTGEREKQVSMCA